MDFKLDQGTDALFDKFIEQDVPYPPVVDVNRVNVCEGYAPAENPNLLDNVAWAFNDKIYESLQNFWMAVYDYNEDIDNNLDDYAPHSTIFNSKKVKVMYEAYIKDEKSLWKYENFSIQILSMESLKMMDCIMLKSWQNARLMKTISEQ